MHSLEKGIIQRIIFVTIHSMYLMVTHLSLLAKAMVTHLNLLAKAMPVSTHKVCFGKKLRKLSQIIISSGAMININYIKGKQNINYSLIWHVCRKLFIW